MVPNDGMGLIANNFVHYDTATRRVVYNQTGGGGGGGTSVFSSLNVSSLTTTTNVVAGSHVLGEETTQIVDYNFSNFGQTWTQVTSAGTRQAYPRIVLSATGKHQLVSLNPLTGLLVSNDYGASFTSVVPGSIFLYPCVSATGQHMYAGVYDNVNALYASHDFGVTWLPMTIPSMLYCVSATCSADGQLVLLGQGNAVSFFLRLSRDFGATWSTVTTLPSDTWVTSMSATGQYIVATPLNSTGGAAQGRLYVSNNFGEVWTSVTAAPLGTNRQWQFCTVSSDGSTMLASALSDLYVSRDYGITWSTTPSLGAAFFPVLSLSYTGQYQLVTGNATFGLYYSSNYGQTFTATTFGSGNLAGGLSANAQYMLAGDGTGYLYTSSAPTLFPAGLGTTAVTANAVTANTILGISSIVAPNSFYAQELYINTRLDTAQFARTWVSRTAALTFLGSSAMSASGQFRAAYTRPGSGSVLYISRDYGTTWSTTTLSYLVNSVAMSASGQYIALTSNNIASAGFIYVSNDYGVSFSQTATAQSWGLISVSASGQYMTAIVSSAPIYRSSDYGLTFAAVAGSPSLVWTSVAVSASGQIQTATISNGGAPYRSTDYGVTFTQISGGPTTGYQDLGMSASGQYQTITASAGKFWISSNFGVTFNEIAASLPSPQIWNAVAISASGQYQVISAFQQTTGPLYASIDYGSTWSPVATGLPSANWRTVSLSASGQYMTLANYDASAGGNIWT